MDLYVKKTSGLSYPCKIKVSNQSNIRIIITSRDHLVYVKNIASLLFVSRIDHEVTYMDKVSSIDGSSLFYVVIYIRQRWWGELGITLGTMVMSSVHYPLPLSTIHWDSETAGNRVLGSQPWTVLHGHGVLPLWVWAAHWNPGSKRKQASLWGGALILTRPWCSMLSFNTITLPYTITIAMKQKHYPLTHRFSAFI